ncbi:hypothetical protein KKA27_00730 [Patescibacteria group bacterium]|nr:hypothetical protein [Patescibacteria group bacterium]
MGNFKRDDRKFSGGRSFGGGKRFGGRDGDKPAMHKATCSECGVGCEIPFRPTGERPVFCSNCFKNQGNSSDRGGDRGGRRPSFGDRQRYDVVCAKCGKGCQVPFRPTASKPVFCDDCFKQGRSGSVGGSKDSGEIMEQINLLNSKIDGLIKILTPSAKTSIEKTKKLKVKKVKVTTKKVSSKKKK